MKNLLACVTLVVLLMAAGVVLIQQYDAWATADLDRNVEEFGPSDTLDSCMEEIDGVWLPWLVAEAREKCSDATAGD